MRRGVSLIELMVVLAILMILMAIMLPVYSRAMSHASGGVCTSNLRQIHASLMLYNTEHEGGRYLGYESIYPPNLEALRLPKEVTQCKSGTPYTPMWYAQSLPDPILVVDTSRRRHHQCALGLFASGKVQRRGGEGDPHDWNFWR